MKCEKKFFKKKRAIKIILALTFCSVAFYSKAQITFSGSVTDQTSGETLANAAINLKNTFLVSETDLNGNFKIENLKKGKYIVEISYLGYTTLQDTLTLSSDVSIHYQLVKKAILSDEVVISAVNANNKSAMAYTNIDKSVLEKENIGQDMPYLLNYTPSMVVTSDGGTGIGYTGIRIRGSDATRVNVTINGVPVNDAESQQTYWVDLPDIASSTDNIQLQRGVGTSTNGAGAFGGSLNIETTKLNLKPYGEVDNSFGSFNTLKNTVSLGTGLIDGKWDFDVRLSKINSDGYIDRAFSNLKSYYLSGGYYAKTWFMKAIIFSGVEKTYQAWYGVPQDSLKTNRTFNPAGMYFDSNGNVQYYNNETDNYQQDYYQLLFAKTFNTHWSGNCAFHYTRGQGYYEEYQPNDLFSNYGLNPIILGNDTISSSDIIRQQWLSNYFYGTTYSLNYTNGKKISASLEGAWNQYQGEHYGQIIWARYALNSNIDQHYYDNTSFKTDFNIFARANDQITEKLNLFADMQERNIGYSFLGYNYLLQNVQQVVHLDFFNPKAGFTYTLKPTAFLYASYSAGNHEPNHDDYTQSSPESRPKPEHLDDFELGYKQHQKNIFWSLNLYYMNYLNQLVLTGQVNDVGAFNRTNVPSSYREGAEATIQIKLTEKLFFNGNITLSQNKIKNFTEYLQDYDNGQQFAISHGETNIAFSPNIISGSELSYQPIKNVSFSFLTKYVGSQFLDNTSENARMLNAYLLNDFRISWSFKTSFIPIIEINGMLNNIFNVQYISNGYTNSYYSNGAVVNDNSYYPQAGINFFAGLTFKF
ncbi:MAG: TonB-dependent receptor [Bacteroidia bacterium]